MLCKSFLLIGVVTGYFPVTPSKAVGKGQDAFRHFCSSFAEPCGYTQADLYFPWCMFLIQKQTLYPVFAMVKVCFGPQSSRVGALSLTVTLHGTQRSCHRPCRRPAMQQLLSGQMLNISYFQRRFRTDFSLICGEPRAFKIPEEKRCIHLEHEGASKDSCQALWSPALTSLWVKWLSRAQQRVWWR